MVFQKQSYLPSQGLILVEIYWEHEMLLKIPLLSPVFTAVGNADGKMVINVWAAFPLVIGGAAHYLSVSAIRLGRACSWCVHKWVRL